MLNKLKQVIELTLTTAFALIGAKWTNFNVLQGVHGVYGVQEVIAIKKAQEVVNVENDGIVGKITINALNSYSPLKFVSEYKQKQIKYYENLVYVNPKNSIYLTGWINRVRKS